jgi:nucleotide-binding universal stress UspA family protein
VVPLDGTDLAERALPWALAFARRWDTPVLLTRVVDLRPHRVAGFPIAPLSERIVGDETEAAAAYLRRWAGVLRSAEPTVNVRAAVAVGDPTQTLLDVERRSGARLVVMTTHSRTGPGRWLWGSAAEALVRRGGAPTLLVRPWDAPPEVSSSRKDRKGLRVLVPLDGSPLAEEILPIATSLAAGQGGVLILASVLDPHDGRLIGPYFRPTLDERRREAEWYLEYRSAEARARGFEARPVLATDHDAAAAIADLAFANSADVIALGTHGRGALGRLLHGSVANRVAHRARVPVLLYRHRTGLKPGGGDRQVGRRAQTDGSPRLAPPHSTIRLAQGNG